jgi:hypothetical protein
MISDITAISVTYNTKELIERAYNSIRLSHPLMKVIIIDGSDRFNPCYNYLESIRNAYTEIIHTDKNIGHGRGMDLGIHKISTKYALIFDSDIIMLKSPVEEMLLMMQDDTYGIGWVYEIGVDGFDFGTPGRNHKIAIPYLHPYFQLINIDNYEKFAPYCHHGAPCYKTMIDIYNKGLSNRILKFFPGLTGHTSGYGINWVGRPSEYIQHDFGGTRNANKKSGLEEIQGAWEK